MLRAFTLTGILACAAAAAAELRPGEQYPPGTRVESAGDGVSFVLPPEWLGGLPPDSPVFLVGSNSRAGAGMIIMRSSASWEDVEALLNQPQDLGDGVVLQPTGAGTRSERGYEISFSNGQYSGHAIGRIGPAGNGAIVFFGGPAQQSEYYQGLTRDTAGSIRFAAPRASGVVQEWRSVLAGSMLKRMSSYYSGGLDGAYVGGSSSRTLHLCSDGSYAYFSSSSVAADAGGGTSGYSGGSGGDSGRWDLQALGAQARLVLRSDSGEYSEHTLTYQNETTYLDGERVFRVRSDRCQ